MRTKRNTSWRRRLIQIMAGLISIAAFSFVAVGIATACEEEWDKPEAVETTTTTKPTTTTTKPTTTTTSTTTTTTTSTTTTTTTTTSTTTTSTTTTTVPTTTTTTTVPTTTTSTTTAVVKSLEAQPKQLAKTGVKETGYVLLAVGLLIIGTALMRARAKSVTA